MIKLYGFDTFIAGRILDFLKSKQIFVKPNILVIDLFNFKEGDS